MKKKLIFHIGRPKTASTFLQKRMKDIPSCLYLGVHYTKKESKIVSLVHKKLFPSFKRDVWGGAINFTSNSLRLVEEYAKQIVGEMDANPTVSHIILSDEAIGDYYNHMAEYNVAIVVAIGNLVRELVGPEKISCHLTFAIRKQDTWLWSFFHHHSNLSGSFADFIGKRFNLKETFFSGLLYYECLLMYRLLSGEHWSVKAIPFELLTVDGNATGYLTDVCVLNNDQIKDIDTAKENSKEVEGNNKKILLKANRYFWIGRLGFRICEGRKKNIELSRGQDSAYLHLMTTIVFKFGRLLLRVDTMLKKFKKATYFETEPPAKLSGLIMKEYAKDNSLLKRELEHYELERYGY